MKKLLVMAASLALIITLSVTGTLAFDVKGWFHNTDESSNAGATDIEGLTYSNKGRAGRIAVFENDSGIAMLANIQPSSNEADGSKNTQDSNQHIEQKIQQRSNATVEASLDNLTVLDDKQLLPSPGSNECTSAKEGWTMWNVGGLDRIVTVTNVASATSDGANSQVASGESVYVRTVFAFENPDGLSAEEGESFIDRLVKINYNASAGEWKKIGDVELTDKDNKPTMFRIYTYTYTDPLAVDATSEPSLKQVVLDAAATNEDVSLLGGGFEMKVVSQAAGTISTTSYNNAEEALNTAFGGITTRNNPWSAVSN